MKLSTSPNYFEIFKKHSLHCSVIHVIMVVDIMVPTHSVIRFHKKKIESSPSMIFPQGMVTTKVLPSAHTISNLQQ